MIWLESHSRAALARSDLASYLVPMTVEAKADGGQDRTFTVARLAMDRLLWEPAQRLGALTQGGPVAQDVQEMLDILTDGLPDIRFDLDFGSAPTDDVVFLHQAVFHPDLSVLLRAGILYEALGLLGSYALTAMWRETAGLDGRTLVALGFRKIAGTGLLVRHAGKPCPFGEEHRRGVPAAFTATPDHEQWVNVAWDAPTAL